MKLNKHIKIMIALLLVIACAASAKIYAGDLTMVIDNVTKKTLENGMTVLVREDHSSPVATVNVWVKTGYFNERDEWTGISHMLEHMFFKGTETRPVGKIQDEVKSVGGYWNAGTIYDHTNYYIVVPSSEVDRALDIEADALQNSTFDAAELDKEHEVVIQEILRKYDRPDAMVWENMMDLIYTKHHIGRWRMGTPEQVRAMDRDVMVDYYTKRYRPGNIVLVVVGDVDTTHVFEEVERLFGQMEKGEIDEFSSPAEPPQNGFRYRQDSMDVTTSYLSIGFPAPPALDADETAVEAMSHLLGSGSSSRLYRELKQRNSIVNRISTGYYALPGVGTFYIEAELDAEKIDDARNAIFREIERLATQPPDESELEKIKASIEYQFIASMEEVSGQSNTLAFYESLGDYKLLEDYVNKLRAVKPEDISRAARQYLAIEKCSMQELLPTGKETGEQLEDVEKKLREAIASAEFETAAKKELPAFTEMKAAGDREDTKAEVHELSNGMKVITMERHRLPLISAGLYFNGGKIEETPDKAGLTRLTMTTSIKGTTTRDAEQIQDEAALLGAAVSSTAGADYSSFTFGCLSRKLRPVVDLVADIVLNPTFPEDEIEKEKVTQAARIRNVRDNMYSYPMILTRKAAYGDVAYGLPADGFEETVEKFTRDDVVNKFRSNICAERGIVVAVGDFSTPDLLALLEDKFAALPRCETVQENVPDISFATGELVEERNKSQSAQAFMFPAVTANHPDVPALNVLRNIASGMGGRLYDEVREKNNLAYTVRASLSLHKHAGAIINYAATSPENEEKARDMMLAEWKKMAGGDITEEEFENAVRYTVGIHSIMLQANSDHRSQLARNFFMERGLDYDDRFPGLIEALTLEDINRVAAEYTASDDTALGVVRAVEEKE